MADWIWMPFGVVSGVGQVMGASKEEEVSGVFVPIVLNGSIFRTEIYSTHAWKVDNISIRTIYCWKRLFISVPEI